jgi:hypothetical protein
LDRSEWLTSPCGSPCDPAVLADARAAFETAVVLIPRILGVLCFVGAATGAVYTGYELLVGPARNTTDAAMTALALYILSLAGFCALFLWFSSRRRRWFNMILAPMRAAHRPLAVPASPSVGGGEAAAGILGAMDRWIVTALFVFLVFILAVPSFLNAYFPRLFLVPVLLGAWVPVLGWFGRWSFFTRVPLIAAAILFTAIFSYFVGDNHDVTVEKGAYNGQIDLAAAVSRWKQANDCGADKQPCPSPIIVASAGGANRAAYMTASALGLLLDATCSDGDQVKAAAGKPQVSGGCKQPPLFARRLFAISSVSGGSLGAVVYARSYRDGTNDTKAGYQPPCQAKDLSRLWFGHGGPRTWRDCVQEILAEDFLSPVFAGLGFRDVFSSFGKLVNMKFPGAWPDRGQLLEKSWIDAYDKYVEAPKGAAANTPSGLDAPFTSLAPGSSRGSDWNPLLLLNATSVETGRRVIASHIAPAYPSSGSCAKDRKSAPSSCVRLFTDAYDMHELLNDRSNSPACAPRDYQANDKYSDLSLAAAAGNSARFPVVSPAGSLIRPDTAKLVGRLADGGYFDNYGALTAFDLADTLRWEYDLYPFVILITNDPGDNDDPTLSKGSLAGPSAFPPAEIKASAQLFASVVAAPVDTFFNVRSGHGSTALKLLRELIDPHVYQKEICGGDPTEEAAKAATKPADQPPASCYDLAATTGDTAAAQAPREPCFAHLGVYPQETEAGTVKDISMSWWLSKPVQDYLDSQLKKPWIKSKNQENLIALELICKVVTLGVQEGPTGSRSPLEVCRNYINPPDTP